MRRSSWPYSGRVPDDELRIEPAGPARALAVLLVVAAVALVTIGTLRGGLERAADDPVPPWTIAVLTVLGGLVLAWRALTQSVVIGGDGLVIRNVSSTSRLHWSAVEELRPVSRPGLSTIEVHLRGTRRRHHLGAASRWGGAGADEVVGLLAAHRVAGELLDGARS